MSTYREKKVRQILNALNSMPTMPGDYIRGANSPKSRFLDGGESVLRALVKDLGLSENKIRINKAGIAVTGEVTLIGMWSEGNGIYIQFTGSPLFGGQFMYRKVQHMADYSGGKNRNMWMRFERLNYDWDGALEIMLRLRKD